MKGRARWVGATALVGLIVLGFGAVERRAAEDARPQAPVREADADAARARRSEFIQAGRFLVNRERIDYVERSERGQLYVYFTSKNSIVLNGDAADTLLQALLASGRGH